MVPDEVEEYETADSEVGPHPVDFPALVEGGADRASRIMEVNM